jgi:L-lysine 2,3-aminomutase
MIARSLSATQSQPDWRVELRDAIGSARELLEILGLDPTDPQIGALAERQFASKIPRPFVARMRYRDLSDPLLRQVLASDIETLPVAGFSVDAVGDGPAHTGDGVLHKYQSRVLLIATGACAVHCRYCFRRHFPYADALAARADWAAPLRYLDAHPEIDEVILSGGDPLSLATSKLVQLTEQLATRPSIRRLRIHTRFPVVLPARVDAELTDWLTRLSLEKVIVIHVNHAQELGADVRPALADLRATGALLLNQAVLLRGVNDSLAALIGLSKALIADGVLPYYLHLLDRVHGSAHFEVDEPTGTALIEGMKRALPGFLVPRLAREEAGLPSKRFG